MGWGGILRQSGKAAPAHMLNEVTDDAVVKVLHLCPRYALAKGDIGYRSKSQESFKDLTRPRLPLATLQRHFRKAPHSERACSHSVCNSSLPGWWKEKNIHDTTF